MSNIKEQIEKQISPKDKETDNDSLGNVSTEDISKNDTDSNTREVKLIKRLRPLSTEKKLEMMARKEVGNVLPVTMVLTAAIPTVYILYLMYSAMTSSFIESEQYLDSMMSMIPIYGLLMIIAFCVDLYYKHLINKRKEELRDKEQEEILDSQSTALSIDTNAFDELSNLNISHLNNYYKQTYDQCDKSFKIAKNASNFGYTIIILGIIIFFISFKFVSDESRVIIFGITSASGIIIKMISSIYFYLYNKTVREMSKYHNKLYTIQNILVSLELSGKIEDTNKRDEIRVEMIRKLLDNKEKEVENK